MELLLGDCVESMRKMPDNSVDSIVTDPPYELGFMGKSWDSTGIANSVEMWREALRVLKPGGHLLAFSGSRTYHRMACAIEDAGFEIRDQIMWVYGCLDEKTEVATSEGVKPYHKTKVGDTVLCYDALTKTYSYQPILEIVEYDYNDTAYRLIGDTFEQVVSRNHRVIVEQDGSEVFNFAETLKSQARVPILENLPKLQKALHDQQSNTGIEKQDLLETVCECPNREGEYRADPLSKTQRAIYSLRRLWDKGLETRQLVKESGNSNLFPQMQRGITGSGMEGTRIQGSLLLDKGIGNELSGANDGGDKSSVERWSDLPQSKGFIRKAIHKICSVSRGLSRNGSQRRICNGTSHTGSDYLEKSFDSDRNGASHQPQCNRQCGNQSDVVQNEWGTQSIREWSGHKISLVRVVPFQYTGKVWCLRVPTGAFVAVRNGVAFPTGNSGFPKSHNISKAIDKAAGAEREVVSRETSRFTSTGRNRTYGKLDYMDTENGYEIRETTAPSTPEAQQWDGWGTALKPAHEPIVLARKPFPKGYTVAKNVLEFGTGGLNIDGSRVEGELSDNRSRHGGGSSDIFPERGNEATMPSGRWPANFIHDGSDEVVAGFPEAGNKWKRNYGVEDYEGKQYSGGSFGGGGYNGVNTYADSGSASRFFYCAKTSKRDRNEGLEGFEGKKQDESRKEGNVGGDNPRNRGVNKRVNHHPTVKPTDLMRYLCRLITPPNGIVLDPFMGSGSTGKAAVLEGFQFIGCEMEQDYIEIARARINHAINAPEDYSIQEETEESEFEPSSQFTDTLF